MTSRDEYYIPGRDYAIYPTLDNLKRRLQRGDKLRGRVVDILSDNRIILRVRGYNVLTEVKGAFKRFEELDLVITQVFPRIEFQVQRNNKNWIKACHVVDLRL